MPNNPAYRDDAPTPEELRIIDRHPLTRQLQRELLACFERWRDRAASEKTKTDTE